MKITIEREVLEQALDYIDAVPDDRYNAEHIDHTALINALRAALTQASEPVQDSQPIAEVSGVPHHEINKG